MALIVWLAVLADRAFGDPRRFHPLAGFGNVAGALEKAARRWIRSTLAERIAGIVCVVALLTVGGLAAAWLLRILAPWPWLGTALEIVILYFCIAPRSLEQHAERVRKALQGDDLAASRDAVGYMVSRDTTGMQRDDVARATVESVLENGNDAVFAALFWFLLLGAPGALMFRLSNTLDAMWGYRNDRYLYFGWAAARLDDVLNFVPARLTALTYCLAGNLANGWRCWHEQARHWYSPNAGPVMAAGAGALCVQLGGGAQYGGQWKERPALGAGHSATVDDIAAAIGLLRRSLAIWLAVITIAALATSVWVGHG